MVYNALSIGFEFGWWNSSLTFNLRTPNVNPIHNILLVSYISLSQCPCGSCLGACVEAAVAWLQRRRTCAADRSRKFETTSPTICITDCPSFTDNCLNSNVLEASRWEYQEQNGPFGDEQLLNEYVWIKPNVIIFVFNSAAPVGQWRQWILWATNLIALMSHWCKLYLLLIITFLPIFLIKHKFWSLPFIFYKNFLINLSIIVLCFTSIWFVLILELKIDQHLIFAAFKIREFHCYIIVIKLRKGSAYLIMNFLRIHQLGAHRQKFWCNWSDVNINKLHVF